jgi:hypothetical protein
MPLVNPSEILDALREFTARERVDLLPFAPDPGPLSAYPPVARYLFDLKNGSKPESAAGDLFTVLSEVRARYLGNPRRHAALDDALALRAKVRADFVEHFQGANVRGAPAGFALHSWPCWFDAAGNSKVGQASSLSPSSDSQAETGRMPVLPCSGFDGIIGNPKVGQASSLFPASDSQPETGRMPVLPCSGLGGIIGNPRGQGFKPFRKEFTAGKHDRTTAGIGSLQLC